jgi:hypothetical protein
MIISGCGTILNQERPKPDPYLKFPQIKKVIIKRLSFLPYINYVPDIDPTKSGKTLLDELNRYENIVDDHVKFDIAEENKLYSDGKRKIGKNLLKRRKQNDTIEEKILDINEIRKLTSRYEKWSLVWDEKTTLVGNELSLDEIDLIKSEIRRISKKL